jgi:hypothetical protein
MTATSDPFLHRVDARPDRAQWSFAGARHSLASRADPRLPAPRSLGKRIMARAIVIGAAALVALRAIGGWVAEPLLPAATTTPVWNVEVANTSAHPTLALAYHRESGVHLLRIPGRGAADDRRVLPAKIAYGELHLMSLGWGQLDVRGRGPRGAVLKSYSATSRSITVFSHAQDTGVRTGW